MTDTDALRVPLTTGDQHDPHRQQTFPVYIRPDQLARLNELLERTLPDRSSAEVAFLTTSGSEFTLLARDIVRRGRPTP